MVETSHTTPFEKRDRGTEMVSDVTNFSVQLGGENLQPYNPNHNYRPEENTLRSFGEVGLNPNVPPTQAQIDRNVVEAAGMMLMQYREEYKAA